MKKRINQSISAFMNRTTPLLFRSFPSQPNQLTNENERKKGYEKNNKKIHFSRVGIVNDFYVVPRLRKPPY